MTEPAVLVTGGSGFIAGHCILQLLERGYTVRATMRSLARQGEVRVLRHARNAKVKRVVLTSAFHAVGWGHPRDGRVFTEADWTDIDGPGVDAYAVSKTVAERAAWDFVGRDRGGLELVTMLPVAVMGPVMGDAVSGSNQLVRRILNGDLPGFPNLYFPIVDVRDVALAHVLAMTTEAAGGERFLLSNGPPIAMRDIGALLRERLGWAAGRVPTRNIPDAVMRVGARFSTEMRAIAPDLGYARNSSNDKAVRVLGWHPRPPAEAIIAAAKSFTARGLVKL